MHSSYSKILIYLGKISASMLAAIGLAVSTPVHAITITANVDANISGAIAASASTGLSFGDVSPGITPGAVTVDTSGFRTSVGGVILGKTRPASPAIFQVTGTPNSSYVITAPVSMSLSNGSGNYMTVDSFTSTPSGAGLLDAGGAQTLTVGGTLRMDANQPGGIYSGVLAMTIIYN